MKFKELCVRGVPYGINRDMTKEELGNMPKVSNVDFLDMQFLRELRDPNCPNYSYLKEFAMILCLCHTVFTEVNLDGDLEFNASSPDELALINFAKYIGYEFIGIDESNYIELKCEDQLI